MVTILELPVIAPVVETEEFEICFTVTQEDIDEGKCFLPHECAVAKAIGRIVPEITYISAGTCVIHITLSNNKYYTAIPDSKVTNFISNFDNRKNVKPTNLQLTFKRENR